MSRKTDQRLPGFIALLACSFLLCSPASSADVYRWLDEDGQTHFSDAIPEKYKKTAKRMEARQNEPNEEQRREAEARAARDKAQAAKSAEKSKNAGSAPTAGAAPTPQKQAANDATDCATLHKRYRESVLCFSQFLMANGAVKSEAYAKCTQVPDPTSNCGPPK